MRSIIQGIIISLVANLSVIVVAHAEESVIRACAQMKTGYLRLSPDGNCRPDESSLAWNIQGPAGPTGPPGPALVGSVAFIESSGAVSTIAGGATVEIPGLRATISVSEGSLVWVQGDFHEHRFCDGYLDRSNGTEPWAVDLEIDGVIVASREMHGEQGNLHDHESKPFTWVSTPLAAGDHTVRFLLRPPVADTVAAPPYQAKICLGTDGTPERQSRMVLLELPR